jgi:hypothetical protein
MECDLNMVYGIDGGQRQLSKACNHSLHARLPGRICPEILPLLFGVGMYLVRIVQQGSLTATVVDRRPTATLVSTSYHFPLGVQGIECDTLELCCHCLSACIRQMTLFDFRTGCIHVRVFESIVRIFYFRTTLTPSVCAVEAQASKF